MPDTQQHPAQENINFVKAAEMKREGESYVAIAREIGVSDTTAKRYVQKGEQELQEREQAQKQQGTNGRRKEYSDELRNEVVRLRDEELVSWRNIAKQLDLGTPGTARRVYRQAHGLPRNAPLGRVGKGGRLAWKQEYPEGYATEGDRKAAEELRKAMAAAEKQQKEGGSS